MQPLRPPENVALYQRTSAHLKVAGIEIHSAQIAVDPNGQFRIFANLEPPFRSEFISISPPFLLVPVGSQIKFQPQSLPGWFGGIRGTYKLCPIVEMIVNVPAGMGNSL